MFEGSVAQSVEAADLKSVQCGFESHPSYGQKELAYNISMKEVKECWQLLEEALEVAPSQDVKDAIANVIDQL